MLTRIGLERILVSAAVFLSLFPSWRHSAFFFTASDFLFCASLLTILLTRGLPLTPFGPLTPYWLAGCAMFLASLIVSSLVNGVPMRALVVCAQYLFSFVLIPLTIMGRDQESTISLLQVFAVGAFVTNLVAIVLYYSGYSGDFTVVTGNGRLAGFIGGPNPNAQTIALACPLAICLWLSGRMSTYCALPLLLVLTLALVLTSSNNGIALTGLAMVAFFLVLRDLRILGRALAGLAVCGVLTVAWGSYFLPETFEQRVLGAVRSGSIEEAGTFEDRVALMKEALDMVDDTMILGLGVDQYREISRFGAPVHNTYLLLWAEGGLPALFAWVALMVMVLLTPVAAVARRQPLLGATGFAVALVFVLIGFTTAHMYQRYSVVPLHLAMALVLASAAPAGPRRAPAAASGAGRPRGTLAVHLRQSGARVVTTPMRSTASSAGARQHAGRHDHGSSRSPIEGAIVTRCGPSPASRSSTTSPA